MPTLREQMENKAGGKALVHWVFANIAGMIESGAVKDDAPGTIFGPRRLSIACNPLKKLEPGVLCSGETSAVSCPECIKHPQFAAEYQPRPSAKTYDDIPAEHRAAIEAWEASNGVAASLRVKAIAEPKTSEPSA